MRKRSVLTISIVSALLIAACGSGTKNVTVAKTPTTEATTQSPPSSTSGKLALHRMTEADALKALAARAQELASDDQLSGAVLVAKHDRVLFSHAYGLANRGRGIPNTGGTRFRIGSMNKMFTAVAILQLVEAGKVTLAAPLGTYLPDYPNREIATKVTIDQLLTHTGGTGDIFGPSFDAHRGQLRSLADYVKLYGKRGLEFAPGSQLGVQQLRLHPARRRDRTRDRAELLRLRARAHLRAIGNDQQRILARRPTGPRPLDRIHQATRNERVGPEHRHAALPRNLRRRRLLDRRGPRTIRSRATEPQTAQPPLHDTADHRKDKDRRRHQIRVRLRRRTSRRWERLGRARRRRPRNERGPEDLPQIRLRGRGAGERRPARSTADLGVSRPAATDKAIAPAPQADRDATHPAPARYSHTATVISRTRGSPLLSCRRRASASLGLGRRRIGLRTASRACGGGMSKRTHLDLDARRLRSALGATGLWQPQREGPWVTAFLVGLLLLRLSAHGQTLA